MDYTQINSIKKSEVEAKQGDWFELGFAIQGKGIQTPIRGTAPVVIPAIIKPMSIEDFVETIQNLYSNRLIQLSGVRNSGARLTIISLKKRLPYHDANTREGASARENLENTYLEVF